MKKLLSILLIITFSNIIIAQTTAIPDPGFEQGLINLGLDGTIDGSVLTSNIDTVTHLTIQQLSISDLTGIEDFTALTQLLCDVNVITSLDLSQNTALTYLRCWDNQLTKLNVSQNTALTVLLCPHNKLTNLDVTQNTALTEFNCGDNELTNLDLSQNTALTEFECGANELTDLDLSQNTALTYFRCNSNELICLNVKNGNNANFTGFLPDSNPNLTCIEVDDSTWSTTNWSWITAWASFSTNCNNACSTVGINEHNFFNLSIHPNPASSHLTIDAKQNIQEVNIIDLTGKTVKAFISTTNTINVSDLPKGIYFIKLTTDERTITKKFVKQ